MKYEIAKLLIGALQSGEYQVNYVDFDAPLVRVLPNGSHEFSPCGVLCDIAPVEVCDWSLEGKEIVLVHEDSHCVFTHVPSSEVDFWCGREIMRKTLNGFGNLTATICQIKELKAKYPQWYLS